MSDIAATLLRRSLTFPFVAEGARRGLGATDISRLYGIPINTVYKYLCVLRSPQRVVEWREKDAERMRRARASERARRVTQGVLAIQYRPWTLDEIKTLRDMRRAGASFGVIGQRLGRSRNSVAGKVDRLRDGMAGLGNAA